MSSRVLRSTDAAGVFAVEWRSTDPKPSGHGLVSSSRRRASEIESGRLTEEAERAVQARMDAARREGRAEGEAAGLARAGQRLDPVIAQLGSVMRDLSQEGARLRAAAEEDTVKLAIAIARRVLHRELATDPKAILGLVKAAFHKLNARETHRLRVSPTDAAVIADNRAHLGLPPRVEIAADPSLVPGTAIFETARGELDASIDTQMAEIGRGLADIMKRRAK